MVSNLIARVVPGVPSFAVDEGFRYSIPEPLLDKIELGSVVRVPLGGRRVRGFVIAVGEGDSAGLRPVAAVSGRAPIFDRSLLEVLRWAADHYVAPLSVLLERAAPPNVPPARAKGDAEPVRALPIPSGLDGMEEAVARGQPLRLAWLDDRPEELLGVVARVLSMAKAVMVILATGAEVRRLGEILGPTLGSRVVTVHPELDDRATTAAWARFRDDPAICLVGTPKVALWSARSLGLAIVVQEGRRAMKDRQTPTLHVRELISQRAQGFGHPVIFFGPTPTVELIAAGAELRRSRPGRIWPLVEVVERESGSGLLTDEAKRALRAVTGEGRRSFVFAHLPGYAAASRCVRCRTLRLCPGCGSRPDPGAACRRCGTPLGPCTECGSDRFEPLGAGVGRVLEEVRRVLGPEAAGPHPFSGPVTVGSERDLVSLPDQDLVVLVDADGLVFGTNYRAAEETLRIGARLAGGLRRRTGNRLLLQTTSPDHPVVVALRRGDPEAFLHSEMRLRAERRYPPATQLVVVELRQSQTTEDPDGSLRGLLDGGEAAVEVLGPAVTGSSLRWLVRGDDLGPFRRRLRALCGRWRDAGATVRVDVDPIDL